MRRTGPTNALARRLIRILRKQNKRIWKRVAEELERPARQRVVINVKKIDKYSKPNDVIVVPGKVLGVGTLSHPVTVYAFAFSKSAKEKIEKAGGRAGSLFKALDEIKNYKNVRLMK
ncbi:MAG: 50S ribosomal protein L18e [Sulfolobales archaeon]|nr:50S ribosomal protein L18e [Sulfolobales archaeon]